MTDTLPQNSTTAQHQQPYHDDTFDSEPPSRTSSPTPSQHTSTQSPSSTASSATIKPLPALPPQAPVFEPYRDDPSPQAHANTHAQQHYTHQQQYAHNYQQPYTDTPLTPGPGHPSHETDDNIPLAHLLLPVYPTEAPPSYSVAVRQIHSTRDTLIQYIPSHASRMRPVVVEIDEESGEVVGRTDDVRHSVEKVVAMFIVAGLLLVLGACLAWVGLGGM
jgi:hypothetical protein